MKQSSKPEELFIMFSFLATFIAALGSDRSDNLYDHDTVHGK